jgi:ADP-ribose pyrophosphatase YjhB (NUDIX family)
MREAARAIIIEGDRLLVMHRHKHGTSYYTLVGGAVQEGESREQALVREVKEETGLDVISARPVYWEEHPAPYNEQYIYLCTVAPHGEAIVQEWSEEGQMNRLHANVHTPVWIMKKAFASVEFRTPNLQAAILKALKKGFPKEPIQL